MTSTDTSSINPVSANLLSQSLQNLKQSQDKPAPAKEVKDSSPAQNQQSSTVVKLSAEGQHLSRSESQSAQSSSSQSSEQSARKPAEPPGIQFMESKSKGGRVSTYA